MDYNTSLNPTGYYYLMPRFDVLFYFNSLLAFPSFGFTLLDKNDGMLEVDTLMFTLLFLSLMANCI